MKAFILTFCFLFFRSFLFGQVIVDYNLRMIDAEMFSFLGSNQYDTALIRKYKVESCHRDSNRIYYFDSIGRVSKSKIAPYKEENQVLTYHYITRGDTVVTEISSPKMQKSPVESNYKIYKSGLLIKDSFSLGGPCYHFEYYQNGGLRQELLFFKNHVLEYAKWFGVDSLARITRVVERDYMRSRTHIIDPAGQLRSNRNLLYNKKGQLIKIEEAVSCKGNYAKGLACLNEGSATLLYDSLSRISEIIKPKGTSQRIKYLDNGLIDEIESTGKAIGAAPYHWHWKFTYTYRK